MLRLPVKQEARIRSDVCDNTFEPLRILEVDRGVQQVTNIDVEHLVGMHDRKFLHGSVCLASRWQGLPYT